MEDKNKSIYSGIENHQKKIKAIEQRMIALTAFNYSLDLVERMLERGDYEGDSAWDEIARLMEVRKDCEEDLEALSWQVAPSDLSQIEFYAFSIPKSALIAVKMGVKPLLVYSNCVTEIYQQRVCYEKCSLTEVEHVLREARCELTEQKLTEQQIQDELVDLGKHGEERFYQGSVLLIENYFV
ncbi:hypothetical protein [Enterococcus sp. DIV0187]|uniref:hypothetical protein n=1 Tax=Enterococcus sp. DIV0187 TaxID=2774644 RepID=UPI003F23D3AA